MAEANDNAMMREMGIFHRGGAETLRKTKAKVKTGER
jgi:hypothetical protein